MYTRDTSNSADTIDSRDIIDRIKELEEEKYDLESSIENEKDNLKDAEAAGDEDEILLADDHFEDAKNNLESWIEDYQEELNTLKELAEECEEYSSDWKYGVGLIRDSYFEEYAQNFAEEIGLVSDNVEWPYTCIDWEQAAGELKYDYTCFDYDGVMYWIMCN